MLIFASSFMYWCGTSHRRWQQAGTHVHVPPHCAVSRTQNGGSVGKARSLWQWPLQPWAWSSLRAHRTAVSWPFTSVASSGLWFCSAGAWGCPVPPAGRSTAPVEDAGNAWPSSARCGGRRLVGCHEGCEQRGKEDDSLLGRSITCCLVSLSQVPCWAGVKLKWKLSPFQGEECKECQEQFIELWEGRCILSALQRTWCQAVTKTIRCFWRFSPECHVFFLGKKKKKIKENLHSVSGKIVGPIKMSTQKMIYFFCFKIFIATLILVNKCAKTSQMVK